MLLAGLAWFLGCKKPNQLVLTLARLFLTKTKKKPVGFGY
jgi:hypothetical protein